MGGGWIEIGECDSFYSQSFIRAIDEGGMIYEDEAKYNSMDSAFAALDTGIKLWLGANG